MNMKMRSALNAKIGAIVSYDIRKFRINPFIGAAHTHYANGNIYIFIKMCSIRIAPIQDGNGSVGVCTNFGQDILSELLNETKDKRPLSESMWNL